MARNLAVGTEFRGFDRMSKPIKIINKRLDRMDKRIRKTGRTAKKASNSMLSSFGKAAVGVGSFLLAFRGFRAVKDFLFESTRAASDFFEENQKFKIVFRDTGDEAINMRKNLVESYGTSRIEATRMLAGVQDFLVPMGIVRKEAAGMSGEFVKLAVDLGSFNNMPTEDVLNNIKSALSGMPISMRKFGIDVSQTALKQLALNEGMKLVNGKMTNQQRALLVLKKMYIDGADAVNDYDRNQGSYANNTKELNARIEDIKTEMGDGLLPVMNKLNFETVKLSNIFLGFAKENQQTISNEFLNGIQLAIRGFGLLIRLGGGLMVGFKAIQFVFSGLVSVMVGHTGFILDAFAGMGLGIVKIWGVIAEVGAKKKSVRY